MAGGCACADPGAPAAELLGSTVADVSGRFDLPAPIEAGPTYAVCFRPGEGVAAVSRLGERLPDNGVAGPDRSPLALAADRVSRLGPDDTVAAC